MSNLKNKIVSITGHRPNKLFGYGKEAEIKLIDFAFCILENHQPKKIITGMALGWDQAVAEVCIELQIPFIAAVPFKKQDSVWTTENKSQYQHLLEKSEDIFIVSQGEYAAYKLQVRNQWMVDNSEALLALWDGSSGGTCNCVSYAQKKSREIVNEWSNFARIRTS